MSYVCAQCALAVIATNGDNSELELIKACLCEAPVIAKISATVYGLGGVDFSKDAKE